MFLPPGHKLYFVNTKETFLSLSHNPTSGYKMPSTQPLLKTLHLYSSALFYLLNGNCLNPLMVNKSALDMIS